MLSDMHPYFLYPLLASSLDDYFQDLLLLSFLGSMEEEEYEEESAGDDWDDDDEEDDEDDEEEEEDEDGDEGESDYEESEGEDDDDDDVDEPVPPKRRLLNNLTSQPMGAGSSTATVIANHHADERTEQGNSSQSGFASQRAPSAQPTVSLGFSRALIQISQRPVQLQHALLQNHQQPTLQSPNTASSPNLHSRSQQVQTDTPENSVPRPLVRQVSQHNLPQARVVLRLPNNIGDMYPREE